MTHQAAEFFRALYGAELEGSLVLWTKSRKGHKSLSDWCSTTDQALQLAKRYRQSKHVYYGVCLQDQKAALESARQRRTNAQLSNVRGTEETTVYLPAVWVDIDVAGEGHKAQDLPPSRAAAKELLAAVSLPPTALVWSGGGYHAYWRLDGGLRLQTAQERAAAKDLLLRLQWAIVSAAAPNGWRIDNTADLARVLRVPNTFNHKTDPPRRSEIELLESHAYKVEDFDLPDAPPRFSRPKSKPSKSKPSKSKPSKPTAPPKPPASWRFALDGCGWLQHCVEDQAQLTEPEWYAALSIATRCSDGEADGRELGHRISRGYSGYSEAETDDKIRQALSKSSARSCASIAALGAWEPFCSRCSHWDRIKSPIVLGRRQPTKSTPPKKPRISVTPEEWVVGNQVLAELAQREPNLYKRMGKLVHVIRLDEESQARKMRRSVGSPQIRVMPTEHLRETVTRHVDLVKETEDEVKRLNPPAWLASNLVARGAWGCIRHLEAVVEGPVLRPDGTVLQEPGYDAESGLLYLPNGEFDRVPERPTAEEISAALKLLQEVVIDFPFAGEAHYSAWLASVLTLLARFAFAGPSPVYLVDANIRGAGKSLLAHVTNMIVSGREAATFSYDRNDQSELRKSITAFALAGDLFVLMDNVSGLLGDATLDRVLTSSVWKDRRLGKSEDLEIPLRITWMVTGNNVVLGADTQRRAVHVRLDSPEERPEYRTQFKHPRLLDWLAKERHRVLPAALTLLRGYWAAGRPDQSLSGWGSFEEWSDVVRGCLVWLGLEDPAETRMELEETDTTRNGLGLMLEGLSEMLVELGGSATAQEIVAKVATSDASQYESLREAFADLPRVRPGEMPSTRQLGHYLRSHIGQWVDGLCVRKAGTISRRVRWAVEARETPTAEVSSRQAPAPAKAAPPSAPAKTAPPSAPTKAAPPSAPVKTVPRAAWKTLFDLSPDRERVLQSDIEAGARLLVELDRAGVRIRSSQKRVQHGGAIDPEFLRRLETCKDAVSFCVDNRRVWQPDQELLTKSQIEIAQEYSHDEAHVGRTLFSAQELKDYSEYVKHFRRISKGKKRLSASLASRLAYAVARGENRAEE